jgi:hypothetical protein
MTQHHRVYQKEEHNTKPALRRARHKARPNTPQHHSNDGASSDGGEVGVAQAPHYDDESRHVLVSHHDDDPEHPVFGHSGSRVKLRHLVPLSKRAQQQSARGGGGATSSDEKKRTGAESLSLGASSAAVATTTTTTTTTTTINDASAHVVGNDASATINESSSSSLSSLDEMLTATGPARDWLQKEVRLAC